MRKKSLLALTLFGRHEIHSWTNRAISTTGHWYSLAWSPKLQKLAAVGLQQGVTAYSISVSDDGGTTWEAKTPPAGEPTGRIFEQVIWVGGTLNRWVACANNADGNPLMSSTNGETWTAFAGPLAGTAIFRLATNDTQVLAFYASGAVYRTTDLTSWTAAATPPASSLRACIWVATLGLYVGVGTNLVSTSPDANIWTARVFPIINRTWAGIAWSERLGLIAAVNEDAGTSSAATSPNGIDWTMHVTPSNHVPVSIAASDADADAVGFCAVGSYASAAKLMTSVNGSSWVERTAPAGMDPTALWGVAYVPVFDRFCTVGYNGTSVGKCATSTTGS